MQHRPGLSVTHPIRHAWVDPAGRLAFPSVLHWVPSQSTLLAVVSEALAELTGSQPASVQSAGNHGSGKTVSRLHVVVKLPAWKGSCQPR